DVDLVVGQQGVGCAGARTGALGHRRGGSGVEVGDDGQREPGQPLEAVEVLPRDVAAADEPDPHRLAHSRPRLMIVLTWGSRSTSTRWPGVLTKILPLPHSRVQTAGEVTSRCQGSHGRTFWVVVASTSM